MLVSVNAVSVPTSAEDQMIQIHANDIEAIILSDDLFETAEADEVVFQRHSLPADRNHRHRAPFGEPFFLRGRSACGADWNRIAKEENKRRTETVFPISFNRADEIAIPLHVRCFNCRLPLCPEPCKDRLRPYMDPCMNLAKAVGICQSTLKTHA